MSDGQARIQLLALGPPEVRADDEIIELPPKLLGILAYLVVKPSRDAVRRDSLLAAFWPEADASHARNALNQAIYQLRRRLGRGVLKSRGKDVLVLNGSLDSDVEQFESWVDTGEIERALATYRGPFLEGLYVRGAPGFEHWLDGVRTHLTNRAREAALRAAATAERDDRLRQAIGFLRRVIEIVPTDERAARKLIRLLITAGDRAEAARVYQWLALRLKNELGMSPSDATRDLMQGIGEDATVVEIVSRPDRHRRLASELTERGAELMKAGRSENLAARELLEQAIRTDPTFAPAHAHQALAIADWIEQFGGPSDASVAGQSAAGRALQIDSELPEAHLARGVMFAKTGQLTRAIRSFRHVLRLRPGDSTAASRLGVSLYLGGHFTEAHEWIYGSTSEVDDASETFHGLALLHMSLDQRDLAEEWYRRAMSSRPDDRLAQSSRVYFLFTSGHIDRAIEQGRSMVQQEPGEPIARYALGDALFVAEQFGEAIAAYEFCYAIDENSRNWGHLRATRTALGYLHLHAGDASRGRRMLEASDREIRRLLRDRPSFGALHLEMAAVLAAQGKAEGALYWLERAYEHGWLQYVYLAMDPIFTNLRNEPRFKDVVDAMRREVEEQRGRLTPSDRA